MCGCKLFSAHGYKWLSVLVFSAGSLRWLSANGLSAWLQCMSLSAGSHCVALMMTGQQRQEDKRRWQQQQQRQQGLWQECWQQWQWWQWWQWQQQWWLRQWWRRWRQQQQQQWQRKPSGRRRRGSKTNNILLRYEKLRYSFYRYLRVSPGTTGKCMLHDSIRYRNTHSRDPITLLSMDIVVETFLEIGESDLLVSIRCWQDPLYLELWETYLSLSIGLGKQNFMISHNILLIMSVVKWLTLRITHLCLLFSNFKLIKTSLLSSLWSKS